MRTTIVINVIRGIVMRMEIGYKVSCTKNGKMSHMDEWISKMEQMVLFGCDSDSDSCDCDDFDGDACDNCYYNVSVHQTRVMVGCQGRCYYN